MGFWEDKSHTKANIPYIADFDNRYFLFSTDRHGSRNYRTGRLKLCGVGRAYKNVKHACRRALLVLSVSLKSRKSWLFADDSRALEVNSRANIYEKASRFFTTLFESSLALRFHSPDQCFCLSLSLFNFISLRIFFSLEHFACKATD